MALALQYSWLKLSAAQVQILVHVRPADRWNRKRFELLECAPDTLVSEVKRQAR